ncbi:Predicted arabinose efflux permease, MFS family [Marinobacter salarius]|jgi:predicted MFS family arabinose efflux permease|uniref:Predicted arabinose efflux permease, MFS family n=2 Tax=Marinobacter TaxID=2742 RepID=A0ABY1FQ99_9GAMM|nr:MFS transporter [Marinobacter salarius]SFL83280.1 Predicted arabinose efflux permease, MFS family [Marinobacter salarius]
MPSPKQHRLFPLLIFLGAAFTFSVTMIGTTMPTPLYPIYQDSFGFSDLMITIIFATYAFGVIAALVLTGRWSDQIGRRPLLFAGLACSIISDLVFLQADGLAMILTGRVLSGLSAGIFTGTATVAVIELAPPHWREKATFFATAANMGGLGLGPMLAGALSQYLPWPLHLTFLVHIVMAVLAVFCIWAAPETVSKPARPKLSIQRLNVPAEVRSVFIPAAIAGFAGFAMCGFFTSIAPAMMGKVLGYDNRLLIGVVAGSIFIASTLGQFLQGRLPLRLRLPLGCVSLMLGVIPIALGIYTQSLALFIAGAVIAGMGQGISFRAGMGAIAAASPVREKAAVTSTFFVVAYIAISVPVIGLGLMASVTSLMTTGITFAAVMGSLAALALVLLIRRERAGGK